MLLEIKNGGSMSENSISDFNDLNFKLITYGELKAMKFEEFVCIKDGWVEIHLPKDTYPYEIALASIPDNKALLHWVFHLTGKVWMTTIALNEFIKKVSKQNKIKVRL